MRFEKFKEIVESHRPEMTVYPKEAFRGNKKTWGCSVIFNEKPDGYNKVYTYNGSYEDLALRFIDNSTCQRFIDNIKNELEYIKTPEYRDLTGFFDNDCGIDIGAEIEAEIAELTKKLEAELKKEILF